MMLRTRSGSLLLARTAIAVCAAFALPARNATAQATHALIITGVSGEPRLAQQFARDAGMIRDAITRRFGGRATLLAESGTPRSDKAGMVQAFAQLSASTSAGDHVLIVLIGHGSAQGSEARFNIPGPDVTASDLAQLLAPLKDRNLALVIATSASGAFVPALSGPGRTVISATRSGAENEETVFAQHFARALSEDVADVNKDGAVALSEAFDYARREVARFYQQHNRLATEHALLDDNGDGKGSLELSGGGDGARARSFVLRAASAKAADPAVRSLVAERAAIQQKIDALKARKASMSATAYDAELEQLLVDLAEKSQAIRAAEGKQ